MSPDENSYLDSARADWDKRARQDPIGYTAAAGSQDEYEERGKRDADLIVRLLTEAGARFGTALELGCGTGRLLKRLAGKFEKLHGADISKEMIDKARVEAPGVEYAILDGTQLPARGFDVIYCHSVFHHVPRTVFKDYVGEIHQRLAKGGIFLFQLTRPYTFGRRLRAWMRSEPGPHEAWRSRYYTWGELGSMAHGFRIVRELIDGPNMIAVWAKE